MKLTWKGEEGSPDFINIGGYKLRPGKAVEVPDELGAAYALNPFFAVESKVDTAAADAKAAEIKALESDVSAAQTDVNKAGDASAKEAASKRLAAVQAKLDAAKKG